MKRFVFTMIGVISMLLLLMACSEGGNIDKLNGKWAGDVMESLRLFASEQSTDNELARIFFGNIITTTDIEYARSMAEKIFGDITTSMDFDVKAKKVVLSFGPEEREASFKVLSDSGKILTLQSADTQKYTIEFVSNDLIIMRSDAEKDKAVAFRRVNQPANQPVEFIAVHDTPVTYEQAKAWCKERGGRLPRINDAASLTLVQITAPRTAHIDGFGQIKTGDRPVYWSTPWETRLPRYTYWTGTEDSARPGTSWIVGNGNGNVFIGSDRHSYQNRVACVP
jgi:hypothetical protein